MQQHSTNVQACMLHAGCPAGCTCVHPASGVANPRVTSTVCRMPAACASALRAGMSCGQDRIMGIGRNNSMGQAAGHWDVLAAHLNATINLLQLAHRLPHRDPVKGGRPVGVIRVGCVVRAAHLTVGKRQAGGFSHRIGQWGFINCFAATSSVALLRRSTQTEPAPKHTHLREQLSQPDEACGGAVGPRQLLVDNFVRALQQLRHVAPAGDEKQRRGGHCD